MIKRFLIVIGAILAIVFLPWLVGFFPCQFIQKMSSFQQWVIGVFFGGGISLFAFCFYQVISDAIKELIKYIKRG